MLTKQDIQVTLNIINVAPMHGSDSDVVTELKKKYIAMFATAPEAPKAEEVSHAKDEEAE